MSRDPARPASLAALALAAAMCLASGAAVAGDYYLRGGIGLDRPGKTAFTDTDCSGTAPAALYGCGTGGDGAPYRSVGRLGTVPAVKLGLGHATTVEFRPGGGEGVRTSGPAADACRGCCDHGPGPSRGK